MTTKPLLAVTRTASSGLKRAGLGSFLLILAVGLTALSPTTQARSHDSPNAPPDVQQPSASDVTSPRQSSTGRPTAQTPSNSSHRTPAKLAFVGRMIANLDQSLSFYETMGFKRDPTVDSAWHDDPDLNKLLGVHGVSSRTARLTINSNASNKPFILYLHELKGIPRKTIAGYPAWEPGASHFGLVVPDAPALWSELQAKGLLHARSWDGKLIPFPGETQGSIAYLTDPDGLDIEIINQHPATPKRPAIQPGVSHAGLVILDSDKERAFYGDLLGGQLADTNAPWMKGDFTDSAVGGHGNVLRFFNENFPEAVDPSSQMHFELVEFQNRKKPVQPYKITDITVGYVGFEVTRIEALTAQAKAAGAKQVSSGITQLKHGSRAILLRDPDVGGFVELIESPPPAG
jgi:catechol 2,3-dioxygenase-like lactoylglutathione lyase family enzyme